ncbi:MAG: hypothetical protein EAZ23_18630 [Oscillatoriales cyanobacterium]|nr:MAG: hypothetical protein EAZ23_18630 [Oscillatoriales cyanobacterium]
MIANESISLLQKSNLLTVRASPLAYCTIRERGRSHYKIKTEMLPCQLSTVNCQLSTANCQLSTANYF